MDTFRVAGSVPRHLPEGRIIARWCIAGAAAIAAVSLIGWCIDRPALARFGLAEPSLPFTSVAFLFMATAFALMLQGRRSGLATTLLLVPVAVGTVRIAMLPSDGIGIDGWLFGEAVRAALAGPGTRPGIMHALVLVLLPVAIAATPAATRGRGHVVLVIAAAVLGFASLSLLLVPVLAEADTPSWSIMATSLPAAIEAMLLSFAVLAWRSDIDHAPDAPFSDWRVLRLVVPLLLVEPVIASLVDLEGVRAGVLTPLSAELFNVTLNFVAISLLLAWALRTGARQRGALYELTQALNVAPMALVDDEDRILHWSRGCEELYGWRACEARGQFKHVLLNSRVADGSDAAGRPRSDDERELVEQCRDGSFVHVIEQARRVDNPMRPSLLVLSMTDIGARREAEAALRASEERLALAASAHEIGMFEWDVASGRLDWTAGSEQRLGIAAGTIRDYPSWAALVDPDDLAEIQRTIAAAAAVRAPRFSFTYRLQQADGVRRVLEGSARCFYDASGALVRTTGLTVDITPHQEREAALRSQQAQLRSILETVPDAMIVIDARGGIRSFSAAAEQLFGYSADEAIGRDVATMIPGDHGLSDGGLVAAATGSAHEHAVVRSDRRVASDRRLLSARRADGREFPIELHVGEALVGGERLVTGFVRDVSERIAAEDRLSQVHQELMHVIRLNAVGEMAAALAHELNQPLSAIANFVTTAELLVEDRPDAAPLKETLRHANAQALRAGDIIHRLRDFISKRETEMRIEPVESTLREAAALLTSGSMRPDVRVRFALSPKADVMLADRIQVQQVMVNLLRNAFEALATMPAGQREVTIGSRLVSPDQIEISVCDRGPGLSEAILSRMFTPFTSSKGRGGMGIGLSICRRIIESHGGELRADNRPGGGARFRFTLSRGGGGRMEEGEDDAHDLCG